MKRFLLLAALVALVGCCGPVKVEVDKGAGSAAVEFAAGELRTLMAEALQGSDEKYRFRLALDPTLDNGAFALTETEPGLVVLRGGDPAGISHAVYSVLEEVGYTFDITGVIRPETYRPGALRGVSKTIVPKVRWRGIRQHVNFPMDISSYPIEEAEAYLENLVRMRFNKLSVHSYPGQWYERTSGDTTYYAGNFFYGDRHYFYDSELLKKTVRFNDSTFCIPVAEAVYDDEPARSAVAITWMQRLIARAKDLGMMVQFSFEPRMMAPEQTAGLAHKIVDTYPKIDALELITTETGGWGTPSDPQRVDEILGRYFDPAVRNDVLVMAPAKAREVDVEPLYAEIGNIAQALAVLQEDSLFKAKMPRTKLGIYCTVPSLYASAFRLARLAAPGHVITLLPSHGADGVAEGFPQIIRTPEDLAVAEIYSWIEFDGLMYQQQNPVEGIGALMRDMERLSRGQSPSVQFNHWRTAENRTAARYAAEATLLGTDPDAFYSGYATRLGISDPDMYAHAMGLINDADSYSTHSLINIGFCWMGAWRGEHAPFNYVRTENVQRALDLYLEAGKLLSDLLMNSGAVAAQDYLRFVGNRTQASIDYMQAFREAGQVVTREKMAGGTLSEAEKAEALEALDRALLLFDRYMETCANLMPDRGSEGMLVSVWNCPVYGTKLLRSRIGGIPMDAPPHSVPIDAPPLPILIGN